MYKILDYNDLVNSDYSGEAWNVYYELGANGEWWPHHAGEFADELDAWFFTLDEAREFADECYGDEVFEKILKNASSGGATQAMICLCEAEWDNGSAWQGGSELYAIYEMVDDKVVRTDSTL